MKIHKSEKSIELYNYMMKRGYSERFSDEITKNLNTDYTATRMMGYLRQYSKLPDVEVVDEMLAILSDRQRFIEKSELESVNARWNDFLNNGFSDNE